MNKKPLLVLSIFTLLLTSCGFGPVEDDSNYYKINDLKLEETSQGIYKMPSRYTYKDYSNSNVYALCAAPTKGNAKLLVVPVWFTDSKQYIDVEKRDVVKQDIYNSYFGSEETTGWESVSSYYKKDSFDNINLTGTVSDWYEINKPSTSYYVDKDGRTNALVKSASDWYFTNHPEEKRTDYDCDKDGYLDGVMLIYAAPDHVSMDKRAANNLWAYCYWIQNKKVKDVNNPGANVYFWASYDFMYSKGNATELRVGSPYGRGDQSHCLIDAHCFIHEMGHVFGAYDYYDYNNVSRPAAGFSMQDNNIGAHDPFTRFAYGWVKPYVPQKRSNTLTVSTIESSGDLVLLAYEGYNGSPFDEYMLLELYSPERLNYMDCKYKYGDKEKGPEEVGVRLWHVDSRLYGYITQDKGVLTNNPYAAPFGILHATANTTYVEGSSDGNGYAVNLAGSYDYKMLHLIRNNKEVTYKDDKYLNGSMLFKEGDKFSISDYSKQFVKESKLNSEKEFNWTVSFGKIENNKITLTITR